jgi:hypothetical protein
MPEENLAPDLFDLKFLPAWVKEAPNEKRYAEFAGEEPVAPGQRDRGERERRSSDRQERRARPSRVRERGRDSRERRPAAAARPAEAEREPAPQMPLPAIEVRFVPDARVVENVLAQIKAGHLAYSIFSLARMFLDKPERYDVRLQADSAALFQLGQNGPAAVDRRILENGAFLNEKDNFYRTEVTQSEPIKGNFNAVARCRLSGSLLGPTNHHAYQPQLRTLYEQRFSRRMSFPDYQRQIEIVNDPAVVERWKEEARSVTTYTTLQEDPPLTFTNVAETERHFRQAYLPGLLRNSAQLTVDGVVSRRLPDRSLGRVIENAWAAELRSPTRMMQELIGALRQHGLHIFRHRKGMLFVSPVRARPFQHERASVSSSVAGILATLTASPGITRKQLLEKLLPNEPGEAEGTGKKKLALASDLHWLISEGHVIEFNDGVLDLARTKPPAPSGGGGPNGGVERAAATGQSSGPPRLAADEAPPAGAVSTLVETIAAAPENSAQSEQTEAGGGTPAAD